MRYVAAITVLLVAAAVLLKPKPNNCDEIREEAARVLEAAILDLAAETPVELITERLQFKADKLKYLEH